MMDEATYPQVLLPHYWERIMSTTFGRGAHTLNSMFFKPVMRKNYHKRSSAETIRETLKMENEEVRQKSNQNGEDGNCSWVPHERTGIFYPKGHEKVMEDIPLGAGKDSDHINWFSN